MAVDTNMGTHPYAEEFIRKGVVRQFGIAVVALMDFGARMDARLKGELEALCRRCFDCVCWDGEKVDFSKDMVSRIGFRGFEILRDAEAAQLKRMEEKRHKGIRLA